MSVVKDPLSCVPAPEAGVASRFIDGVALALTEKDQTLHTFQGPVASHIWAAIDGSRTTGDILASILSAFEVEAERARTDLLQFVELLRERGLIVLRS
jgi:hypothetical protein